MRRVTIHPVRNPLSRYKWRVSYSLNRRTFVHGYGIEENAYFKDMTQIFNWLKAMAWMLDSGLCGSGHVQAYIDNEIIRDVYFKETPNDQP